MEGDGWRDVIRDSVAARAAAVPKPAVTMSRVGFSPAAHRFLVRAANERGITLAGYVRRATMAHVAMDLGIDPIELFEADIGIRIPGDSGYRATKDLDGELFGRWEVRPDGPRHDDHG